ncbi:MAG: glycosyltransferase, partial [Nanoarchaeota archaeon]|nr:glycosyltransferase [Nanoarchaeota archaeon]
KSSKIKFYSLNLRKGKPAVINSLIKKTTGEIIIINDADWIFKVKNKEKLLEFLSVFDNLKVGGIAESFPVEWDKSNINKANFGFKVTAMGSYFWMLYQKKKFTERFGELTKLKSPTMFLTNIFRKELFEENTSLGDDFERTFDIMNKGYEIVLFEDISLPRMVCSYNQVKLTELYKQKIRTSLARKQLKDLNRAPKTHYYPLATFLIFFYSLREGLSSVYVGIWIYINLMATMVSKFKKPDTGKNWRIRLKR